MYIDVGGLDLFYREDLSYAARLLDAYVDMEFHSYPGVPHAFEIIGPTSIGLRALENRKRAVMGV